MGGVPAKAITTTEELADKRLVTVAMVLVNDDGCYQEATFSYAVSMIGMFISIYRYLQDSGDTVPEWYVDRVANFARYITARSAQPIPTLPKVSRVRLVI